MPGHNTEDPGAGGSVFRHTADVAGAPTGEIATQRVTYPDFLFAECVERDGLSYLELTVDGDPADPRTDDITGDFLPGWGLHNVDVNIALGDLVELAGSQAEAYTGG